MIDWIYNPWINQRDLVKWVTYMLELPETHDTDDCKVRYNKHVFIELQKIKDSWK